VGSVGPLGSGYEYGLLTPAVLLVCAGAVVSHGHALVPRCARLLVAVWLRSGSVRLKTLTTPATTTEPYCAPSHVRHGCLCSLQCLRGSRDVLCLNLNGQAGTLQLYGDQRSRPNVGRDYGYESSNGCLVVDIDRAAISSIRA
jgi:hypothetical protein